MDPNEILDDESAGFDDVSDDVVGNAHNDAPTETPDKVVAAPVAEPVEYAQLTKAQFDNLMARAAMVDEIKATQNKSFDTAFGKIGGIERVIQQLQTGAQVDILQEDIDALQEFRPIATALEKIRNMRVLPGAVDQTKIEEIVQQRIAPAIDSINVTVERAVETRLLSRDHPDWNVVTKSPEFLAYANGLPTADQKSLADSWDSQFIGKHIATFKSKTKPTPPTPADPASARRNRMTAAVTPRGNGSQAAAVGTDEESGFNAA